MHQTEHNQRNEQQPADNQQHNPGDTQAFRQLAQRLDAFGVGLKRSGDDFVAGRQLRLLDQRDELLVRAHAVKRKGDLEIRNRPSFAGGRVEVVDGERVITDENRVVAVVFCQFRGGGCLSVLVPVDAGNLELDGGLRVGGAGDGEGVADLEIVLLGDGFGDQR